MKINNRRHVEKIAETLPQKIRHMVLNIFKRDKEITVEPEKTDGDLFNPPKIHPDLFSGSVPLHLTRTVPVHLVESTDVLSRSSARPDTVPVYPSPDPQSGKFK